MAVTNTPNHGDIRFEQGKLRPDIDVVRRYGESHPDDWVELRFEKNPVRIVALFSGHDLDAHEKALRRLMAHPDRLEVRFSPWPNTRLEEIRAEVHQLAMTGERGSFSQWGIGRGKVNITLRADQVRRAEELRSRYGDAVDLTVGYLHFPDCTLPNRVGTFRNPQRAPLLPSDVLEVSVEDGLSVRSGDNLQNKLCLHNVGTQDVVVITNGQVTARIVDPETNETIGGCPGAQTMRAIGFRVSAAESLEIPLHVGTASPAPPLGYATPPGRWSLEVVLNLESRGKYRTPLLPITVIA
jgi:hypothetical protein